MAGLRPLALIVMAFAVLLPVVVRAEGARSRPSGGPAGAVQIAFTQRFNVALAGLDGGNRRTVTHDAAPAPGASVPSGVSYPWYDWSPDGRYLLVVRQHGYARPWTLLLFDANGHFIRNLGPAPAFPADFYPSWARDADTIVLVSSRSLSSRNPAAPMHSVVSRMDLQGHRTRMFSYNALNQCGGGISDPSTALYLQQMGSFLGVPPTAQWRVRQGRVVFSLACGGVNIANTRTRIVRWFPTLSAPALSVTGQVAAVQVTASSQIVVMGAATGQTRTVGTGELPAWAPDGRTLYYVRRTPGPTVPVPAGAGQPGSFQMMRSAIWRVTNSSRPQRLVQEDAFAFGRLNVTPDNRTLIYSRVDNPWNLYRHHLPIFITNSRQVYGRFGPRVSIQRLDIGAGPRTILTNAGQPKTP